MSFQRERETLNNFQKNKFNHLNFIKIKDIFNIKNNPSLDKNNLKLSSNFNHFPYFTRSEFNNGITGYTKEIPNNYKISGNSISVGLMAMKFFYQNKDFCSGQFTKTLIPKNNFNENLGLFYLVYLNNHTNILKANLVRDFDKLTNEILIPYLKQEEINIFISAIKKLVIKDLVIWYENMLNNLKQCLIQ